jgi:hypothetical protein
MSIRFIGGPLHGQSRVLASHLNTYSEDPGVYYERRTVTFENYLIDIMVLRSLKEKEIRELWGKYLLSILFD